MLFASLHGGQGEPSSREVLEALSRDDPPGRGGAQESVLHADDGIHQGLEVAEEHEMGAEEEDSWQPLGPWKLSPGSRVDPHAPQHPSSSFGRPPRRPQSAAVTGLHGGRQGGGQLRPYSAQQSTGRQPEAVDMRSRRLRYAMAASSPSTTPVFHLDSSAPSPLSLCLFSFSLLAPFFLCAFF